MRAWIPPLLAAWLAAGPFAMVAAGDEPPVPAAEAPADERHGPTEDAADEAAGTARGEAGAADAPAARAEPVVPRVQVTEAGPQLLIEDLRPGTGIEAAPGMQLAVHYTGWLHEPAALGYRGRQFDSSRDRGSPLVFPLGAGRVIRGWEVGLIGLRVGGLRRLVIPPELAYGRRDVGNGLIPPNSTLVFEVELLGVESNVLLEGTK